MILELALLAQAVAGNVSKSFPEQAPVSVVISVPSNCSVTRVVAFTYTVSCVPVTPPLTISTPITLPQATQGAKYSVDLNAAFKTAGGKPPYKYAAVGTLPAGLTLTTAGVLSGTPTVSGNFTLTISITDSSGGTTSAKVSIDAAPSCDGACIIAAS
jgi:hypothetical protein